jgi:hypothetical protein
MWWTQECVSVFLYGMFSCLVTYISLQLLSSIRLFTPVRQSDESDVRLVSTIGSHLVLYCTTRASLSHRFAISSVPRTLQSHLADIACFSILALVTTKRLVASLDYNTSQHVKIWLYLILVHTGVYSACRIAIINTGNHGNDLTTEIWGLTAFTLFTSTLDGLFLSCKYNFSKLWSSVIPSEVDGMTMMFIYAACAVFVWCPAMVWLYVVYGAHRSAFNRPFNVLDLPYTLMHQQCSIDIASWAVYLLLLCIWGPICGRFLDKVSSAVKRSLITSCIWCTLGYICCRAISVLYP